MGKYEKLGKTLANKESNQITYSFTEIQEILKFELPKSSRLYRPWWANDRYHVQAKDGWLNHGWKVGFIDVGKETVTFNKIDNRIEVSGTLNAEDHRKGAEKWGTPQMSNMEEPCAVCYKKGFVECKLCGGRGVCNEEACEICDGTGMRPCPACRGTGKIKYLR